MEKHPITNYSPHFRPMRESACLSQQEAADKLGIARSYLSAIENGKHEPGGELLTRIQDVYRKRLIVVVEDVDSHV